jgi:hypothetical protein
MPFHLPEVYLRTLFTQGSIIHLLVKRLFPEVRPTMAVHGYWLGLNLVLFVLIGFDWVLQF